MTTDAYQDAVHKLMDYMNDTVIFAKAQLPDVAQQMLIYGAEMAHIWMWGWIIVAIACFLFWLTSLIAIDEAGGLAFTIFLAWIGAGACAVAQYSVQLEIRDAPKLYIMEQLANQVKSK